VSCAFCEKNVTREGFATLYTGPPNASFLLHDSLRFSCAVTANQEEIKSWDLYRVRSTGAPKDSEIEMIGLSLRFIMETCARKRTQP
jgi:hypothetical protein